MAETTTEILKANGVVLNTYAKNISTLTGRLQAPAKRSTAVKIPGRHGELVSSRIRRKYEPGIVSLPMWVVGSDDDGAIPASSSARKMFYKNIDDLVRLFGEDEIFLEHTLPDGSIRTARAVVNEAINFAVEGVGDPVGLFTVALEIPDSFWEDGGPIRGLTLAPPVSGSLYALGALHGGTAPIDDLQILVKGYTRNLRISAYDDEVWFTYNPVIPAGASLTIDCKRWRLVGSGVTVEYNQLRHGGDAKWLVVHPTGMIKVSGIFTSDTVIQFTGRRKFLVG